MNIAFFQNCISPHQMPYIEALSKRDEVEMVYVIVPRITYAMRKDLGWPEGWTSGGERLKVMLTPTDAEVKSVLKECDAAMFSGIIAFPEVQHWLDMSLEYDVKRGVITEAPFTYGGKPLWMHKLRFWLKGFKYVKHIDWIFAIGEGCADYYHSISSRWKVVPFMYSTVLPEVKATEVIGERMKVLFVGALEPRKNVGSLLRAVKSMPEGVELTIAGDGPEAEMLKSEMPEARFLGAVKMQEVPKLMSENDVLVLPSWHDGWGAVINEARLVGTITVCTHECGASQIADYAFKAGDVTELANVLTKVQKTLGMAREGRQARHVKALSELSPEVIANKMMRVII